MSKKKNVQEEVKLSNQELIPSVIGVIDNKEKSIWPLILLFVFLIVFIVFLPTVTAYFNGEYEVENKETVDPSKQPDNPPEEEEITFYSFSDNPNVLVEGISFHDFLISNQALSFSVTNNAESSDYLNTHHLYLELYDANQMFLQRIKLTNETIGKGSGESYQYDLTATESLVQQFTITEKTEADYPNVNLKKENDESYSLTCTKNKERLVYNFDASYKLLSITDTINYNSGDSNYLEALTEYRQMSSKYNAINGVTSNIREVQTGFTVTTVLDLNEVNLESATVQSTLSNPAYYPKDTLGKVVHFELSSMNYRCS